MMLACALALALSQERPKAETPKITKVVLYKHGVGYFERSGKVAGDQEITLSFKASQMQDLLTSLFAVDLSGGKVRGITYDSKDPIEKQLENILLRIPEGNALTQFVAELKGARAEVRVGAETIRGSIMGIEPVQQKIDQTTVTTYKLVILRDDGKIQQTSLLDVGSLKLLDAPLEEDLKRVLDIYMKAKYADRKDVKISFQGAGERNVVIGYLVQTPIWKTTYRLIFQAEKPLVQGWAIVDNPTDEDWDGVDLTMVAGNPVSFVMDLYTPHYPSRPEIGLGEFQGATFSLDEKAADKSGGLRREALAEGKDGLQFRKAANAAPGGFGGGGAQRLATADMLARSIEPLTQGTPVGELFAYSSKGPVSVPRGKAALIPIVAQKIDGERVLYHKSGSRVMNAFYMKNTSELTLEGGPVTVFEGSTSLGEGLLSRELKAGMREMISYAVEAGVRLSPMSRRIPKPIHRATLADGILRFVSYQLLETEYKIHNETGKKHVLYLDHPKTPGHSLLDPPKAEEDMPQAYRLRLELADGVTTLKIVERMEVASGLRILDLSPDQIVAWLNEAALSPRAKEFLQEVIKIKTDLANLVREHDTNEREHKDLAAQEERYRANIKVLGESPNERRLRDRYVEQFNAIDERLRALGDTMQNSERKRRELEQALAKKVLEFRD